MIGVKILKGWAACLLKIISSHTKKYLSPFKSYFQKTFTMFRFCSRSYLEFNIYNKTNYMHRKNIKFKNISLITSTTENEVFSPLIMG